MELALDGLLAVADAVVFVGAGGAVGRVAGAWHEPGTLVEGTPGVPTCLEAMLPAASFTECWALPATLEPASGVWMIELTWCAKEAVVDLDFLISKDG